MTSSNFSALSKPSLRTENPNELHHTLFMSMDLIPCLCSNRIINDAHVHVHEDVKSREGFAAAGRTVGRGEGSGGRDSCESEAIAVVAVMALCELLPLRQVALVPTVLLTIDPLSHSVVDVRPLPVPFLLSLLPLLSLSVSAASLVGTTCDTCEPTVIIQWSASSCYLFPSLVRLRRHPPDCFSFFQTVSSEISQN